MPVTDLLGALLARPIGRVVEAPIRSVVHEVLRDQGGAGDVDALRGELEALRAELGGLLERLSDAERRAAEAERRVEELEARLSAPPAAPGEVGDGAPAAAPSAPEGAGDAAPADEPGTVAGSVACAVEDCGESARRDGFCPRHADLWMAGRLPGFVGPEGLVEVDGEPYAVDPALAGRPYRVVGRKRRMVQVDGRTVRKRKLGG